MRLYAVLKCSVWQGNVRCGRQHTGVNNHMHKRRLLKMAVISVGKMTQVVATEPKRIMRSHHACLPGGLNWSGIGQIQMLILNKSTG